MSTIPAAAISESEALRLLNLPTSRRDWLRNQLPSVPMSNGNIYAKEEVTRLADRLETVRRDPDAIRPEANANLHTRIGSPARTR